MKQSRAIKAVRLTIILMIVFIPFWFAITGKAAEFTPKSIQDTSPDFWNTPLSFSTMQEPAYPYWVVRAYYTNPDLVNQLARHIEPWEVHREAGYLIVGVDQAGFILLEQLGFRVEVDERLTQLYQTPRVFVPDQITGILGYPCYRTVEETYASAEAISTNYPNLASWIDIGDSWDKIAVGGAAGYDLKVLKLTNTEIPGPKPKLFITASIHAREYAPAELISRFAEYLVENYGHDAEITWILDYHEIHLMPIGNPDGRKYAENGLAWRKTTNQNYCSPTSTLRGADMNRNFDFYWGCCGGSSSSECDEIYRGPAPASEPETIAIQSYLKAEFPDQRGASLSVPAPQTATGVYLDIHSYGDLVLWPWGFTASPAPNGTALQTFGRKLAFFNGYKPEQAIGLYLVDGASDDYAYGELGVAAFTFELGYTFFENCTTFENIILPKNLQALIYAAKAARTPYITPSGPEARALTISPGGSVSGIPMELTAVIDDTHYNNSNGIELSQPIAAAEYYIDNPPWSSSPSTTAHPMNATDGSYNQTTEAVRATIDTSSLARGRHTLYVRGKDSSGNWGAVSAAYFYLFDPAIDPTIFGYIRRSDNFSPLEATISASGIPGNFFAHSDPYSGYYSMHVFSDTYRISAAAPEFVPAVIPSLQLQDLQQIQQDLYLTPICQLASDNVESGNLGWRPDSPWQISTEAYHSPIHAWTDSPGGYYGNNINISLTSANLDLSNYQGIQLSFWHTFGFEIGFDYGFVEYSLDGGGSWTVAKTFTGSQATWREETILLPDADNQPNVALRFRIVSDVFITQDGWHIDDILITGGGPDCSTFASHRVFLPQIYGP